MFGLVTLVQPEVDGPELLFRLFLKSRTRSTSNLLGTEFTVGPPLPDPYSSNDFDGLVPSGWEDGGPGAGLRWDRRSHPILTHSIMTHPISTHPYSK